MNRSQVPPALQEDLLSRVNAYAARPTKAREDEARAWIATYGTLAEPTPARTTLIAPLDPRDPDLVVDVANHLLDRIAFGYPAVGLVELTRAQQGVVALATVESSILNDGYDSLFYNSYCPLLPYAAAGARLVRLAEAAQILEDTIAATAQGAVPVDARKCQQIAGEVDGLDELGDRWSDADPAVGQESTVHVAVRRFILAHRAQFFRRA